NVRGAVLPVLLLVACAGVGRLRPGERRRVDTADDLPLHDHVPSGEVHPETADLGRVDEHNLERRPEVTVTRDLHVIDGGQAGYARWRTNLVALKRPGCHVPGERFGLLL